MSLTTWYRGEVFEPGKYGLTRVISIAHEGAVLAHVNATWPEAAATADLITAAPDLLKALQMARAKIGGYNTAAAADVLLEVIDAALAKAGGGLTAPDDKLLRDAQALDAQYAEADAFDAKHAAPDDGEEHPDEMAELHKAALSRGQP